MANFIIGIISMTIGVVVLANVFISTVKGTVNGTSTCLSGWNGTTCLGNEFTTAEAALWGLVTVCAIAGMVYGVMNVFGLA